MSSMTTIERHRFGRVTVLFFRLLLKETVILLSTIIIIFHSSLNGGVYPSPNFFLFMYFSQLMTFKLSTFARMVCWSRRCGEPVTRSVVQVHIKVLGMRGSIWSLPE